MPNIILIGFMGSGKTAVGKKISELTKLSFIDLDAQIIKKAGITINEIFDRFGEAHFRRLESEALKECLEKDNCVIATGGGIVTIPENITLMKNMGKAVYLKNSFETSRLRVEGKNDRPLFRDIEKAAKLFDTRRPMYEAAADITVITDSLTVNEAAKTAAEKAGVL